MTVKYKTKAFIFKKTDRNEADRIFSVFTDQFGRLDIYAKAIRKDVSKLRSGIDSFFISDIEFIQGTNKKTLTDAVALEKFNNIYKDIEKFKIANKIGDVLDNFIKGEEKDKEIFNLVNEAFVKLNNCTLGNKPCTLIYYYFLWNLLSTLGYRSEVYECAGCHKKLIPYDLYFSSKEGGVICGECEKNKDILHESLPNGPRKVNSDIVKILRLFLKNDWQTLSKLKIEVVSQNLLKNISDNYYAYILSSGGIKANL